MCCRALGRGIFWACVAYLSLLPSASGLSHAQPSLGREYIVLEPPRKPASAAGIEVIEFFYYGCPICYEAQPHIVRWLRNTGADVIYRRIPAAISGGEESFALTYYALEATGHLARLHWPVYDNHHFDDLQLNDEKNLLNWLARNDVDADLFRAARNSPEIRSMVAAARRSFDDYGIRAVPAFAVDGRYVTSARLAGGIKEMMAVVDYMIDRVRKERARERP